MAKKYPCPCCNEITIAEQGDYEICQVCKWEDDPGQNEHPDDNLGANAISLNEARAKWAAKNTPLISTRQPVYTTAKAV